MQFRFDRVSYQIERFVNTSLQLILRETIRQLHFD